MEITIENPLNKVNPTPMGNYPTLIKFSGKIKKGGLSGYQLYIDIKKENIEKEEEAKHGLPDN